MSVAIKFNSSGIMFLFLALKVKQLKRKCLFDKILMTLTILITNNISCRRELIMVKWIKQSEFNS